MSVRNNRDYADNRFANNFREQQQDSYDNRFENEKSFSQKDYNNDLDYEYSFVDNQQQQSRQTQFFIIYQFNNSFYQNRAYQNQSNYRQQSSKSLQIEADQSYVKNFTQSSFQNQSYKFAESISSNSFQSKNAFDLQFKSQQSSQSYRSSESDYLDNQYQNRSLYEQRLNASAMQQRVYLIENDSKYYNEVFQKNQKYYYDDDSFQQFEKKQFEKIFHDHHEHVFHEQHEHEHVFHEQRQLEQKHVLHEQSSKNEFNDVADVIDVINESKMKFFFIETSKIKFSCRRCEKIFFFNNKLHYHFKRCKKLTFKSKIFRSLKSKIFRSTKIKIIRSFVFVDFASKFDFKF